MSNETNPFGSDNSSSDHYDSTPRKSSGTPWVMIFGIIGALMLGGLVCCGGMMFFGARAGIAMFKAPIDATIVAMEADQEVAQKLGTPIESTSSVGVENYQNNNNNGNATVNFTAKGPNGTATVRGDVDLTAGNWTAKDITVTFSDGSSVNLPRSDAAP